MHDLLHKRQRKDYRSHAIHHALEVMCRILRAIEQNENISHRKLCGKVSKDVNHVTLSSHLKEMQELFLIERSEERANENSPTRHLKPGFVAHYRITDFGREFLRLIWDRVLNSEESIF